MNATEILKTTAVKVAPETFAIVSLSHEQWRVLLADPGRSPRMSAPFMIFQDTHEVTLMVDEIDIERMQPGNIGARIEGGYRMLTFDIVLDLSVTGFMAVISRILADAGIPILPISAFSRDHLLIRQDDLARALNALGPHIDGLC